MDNEPTFEELQAMTLDQLRELALNAGPAQEAKAEPPAVNADGLLETAENTAPAEAEAATPPEVADAPSPEPEAAAPVAPTPPAAPTPATAQKWTRTVRAADGSERTFEADSPEELIDKLTRAQQDLVNKHLARKKAESATSPDFPVEKPAATSLSQDEKAAIAAQFMEDPQAALNKILKSSLGMDTSQIGEKLAEAENLKRAIQERAIAEAWVDAHPEYKRTVANSRKMMRMLQIKGVPLNYENLEQVFQELKNDGMLDLGVPQAPAAPAAQPPVTTPPPVAVTTVPATQPAPTVTNAVPRRAFRSGIPVTAEEPPAPKADDLDSLYKIPLKDLRTKLLNEGPLSNAT